MRSMSGRWIAAPDSRAFLDLADDGTLTGSDGANHIATTWHDDDQGGAQIASFFTTQMAAPGMRPWVGRAHRVAVEGDELAVYDQAGNRLGAMIRDSGEEQ